MTERIQILDFSKKGNGLGQLVTESGSIRTVEVPFAIPGDQVEVKLLKKRSGVYRSLLEEIVVPSSDRISPRCLHFGHCGGCRWQQISYEKQLEEKMKRVKTAFGDLVTPSTEILPIIPCDPPWVYRNKMEFSFSQNAKKEKFLGLIIHESKGKVLNLTECHLVNSWFIKALETVREWWNHSRLEAFHPFSNKGSLRTLTVREGMNTGDRMVFLTVSGNPDYALNRQELQSFTSQLREAVEPQEGKGRLSLFLRIQQTKKGMTTQFYEMHLHGPDHIVEELTIQRSKIRGKITRVLDKEGSSFERDFLSGSEIFSKPLAESPKGEKKFTDMEEKILEGAHSLSKIRVKISPTAFFQPNTRQAEILYSQVLQMAEIHSESIVYDLYCGTATLGLCAAQVAKKVVAVELSPESSLDARTNAADNQLQNISVVTGDVGEVLAKIGQELDLPVPDIVLVDPPRVGLDPRAIKHLLQLRPKKIVYVSCNPTTQALNIRELLSQGYQLKKIQPVDQFPQTVHIENIALLELQ